jgi:hypothetical protein
MPTPPGGTETALSPGEGERASLSAPNPRQVLPRNRPSRSARRRCRSGARGAAVPPAFGRLHWSHCFAVSMPGGRRAWMRVHTHCAGVHSLPVAGPPAERASAPFGPIPGIRTRPNFSPACSGTDPVPEISLLRRACRSWETDRPPRPSRGRRRPSGRTGCPRNVAAHRRPPPGFSIRHRGGPTSSRRRRRRRR